MRCLTIYLLQKSLRRNQKCLNCVFTRKTYFKIDDKKQTISLDNGHNIHKKKKCLVVCEPKTANTFRSRK